jgi:putative oxidoreductase
VFVSASFAQTARAVTYTLLRVVTGLLYLQHGVQKAFGWFGGPQVEDLSSLRGLAGMLEFFGGPLVALGLFTRPVAFVLSGEMAVAYFMVHAPRSFWPILNRGEIVVLFCFTFLFFAAHGGGAYSIDALLRRRPSDANPSTR